MRPSLEVIKSLVVAKDNYSLLEEMVNTLSPWVDAYITDTFDPVTGAEGATGKTHDWSVSRRIVEISPRPVIIAGGLNPGNVKKAIKEIKPAGVDVHTGIEGKNGRKEEELVRSFILESKEGFDLISR